jgi:3-oxoacyl-[acyl-carrier protein] reductase
MRPHSNTRTEAPACNSTARSSVVTGGARGIGKAIATAFAERGARIALLDLNPSDLDATRAEFAAARRHVSGYMPSTSRRKTR